jgi:hypothetical protein
MGGVRVPSDHLVTPTNCCPLQGWWIIRGEKRRQQRVFSASSLLGVHGSEKWTPDSVNEGPARIRSLRGGEEAKDGSIPAMEIAAGFFRFKMNAREQ